MGQIVDLQMKEVSTRLQEHGLDVNLTPAAREWVSNLGFDPAFGARPLRRALQKYVESPLSISLLSGQYTEGDVISVDLDKEADKLVFTKLEKVKTAKSKAEVPA